MSRTALRIVALTVTAACSTESAAPREGRDEAPTPAAPEPAAPSAGRPAANAVALDPAETALLFGDDRVGQTLRNRWAEIPATWRDVEARFGIGAGCVRASSREVFVVEEPRTRANGAPVDLPVLAPRVVVTGCSEDARTRAELLAVLSTDPARASDPDPLARAPVELMAFDATAGAYNFYEVSDSSEGPVVRRFVRDGASVRVLEKAERSALRVETSSELRCFGCHVHGTPIMNELSRPWTAWVSEIDPSAKRPYGGLTGTLVREASGHEGRRSVAYDLQRTVELGTDLSIFGAPERPGTGSGARASTPADRLALLRSAFCPTELNWHPNPAGLFVEPALFEGETLAVPTLPASLVRPRLLPERSLFDRRAATAAVDRGLLNARLLVAVRLLDDEDDLSAVRCGAHSELDGQAMTSPAATRVEVARVLNARFATWPDGAAKTYALALASDATPSQVLVEARAAYMAELRARLAQITADVSAGVAAGSLASKIGVRMAIAEALLPGPVHPRPHP